MSATKEACFMWLPRNMRYEEVPVYHRGKAVAYLIASAALVAMAFGLVYLAFTRPEMVGYDRVAIGEGFLGTAFWFFGWGMFIDALGAIKMWHQAKKFLKKKKQTP